MSVIAPHGLSCALGGLYFTPASVGGTQAPI